jgi:hypothetical protein
MIMDEKERKTEQNKIIIMQKSIVNDILDYQMKYGAGSVSWNVAVSFYDKPVGKE